MFSLPVPEDLEWVILGFLQASEFYSLFTTQLLSRQLEANLVPDLAQIVLSFTQEKKEVYWYPAESEDEIKYAAPSDSEAKKLLEEGRAYLTFYGPDVLLKSLYEPGVTKEERRYFKDKFPTYGEAYDSKNINLTRYLIKTQGLTYEDWMQWYSTNSRPDPIQKEIIDMMVRMSNDETLRKLRKINRGRQIMYVNAAVIREQLARGEKVSALPVDFLDLVIEGQDAYLAPLLSMNPGIRTGISDFDFFFLVRNRKAKAVQLLINDRLYGELVDLVTEDVPHRHRPVDIILAAREVLREQSTTLTSWGASLQN